MMSKCPGDLLSMPKHVKKLKITFSKAFALTVVYVLSYQNENCSILQRYLPLHHYKCLCVLAAWTIYTLVHDTLCSKKVPNAITLL